MWVRVPLPAPCEGPPTAGLLVCDRWARPSVADRPPGIRSHGTAFASAGARGASAGHANAGKPHLRVPEPNGPAIGAAARQAGERSRRTSRRKRRHRAMHVAEWRWPCDLFTGRTASETAAVGQAGCGWVLRSDCPAHCWGGPAPALAAPNPPDESMAPPGRAETNWRAVNRPQGRLGPRRGHGRPGSSGTMARNRFRAMEQRPLPPGGGPSISGFAAAR